LLKEELSPKKTFLFLSVLLLIILKLPPLYKKWKTLMFLLKIKSMKKSESMKEKENKKTNINKKYLNLTNFLKKNTNILKQQTIFLKTIT
jgi:hypothetical protein